MPLADNALITEEEWRLFSNVLSDNESLNEELLCQDINMASQILESVCERRFIVERIKKIDTSGPAVDMGDSTTVGIPVKNHGWSRGQTVTISGSTNYDGTYDVLATTTVSQVVITATYAAETFAGTETVTADIIEIFDGHGKFNYYVKQGTIADTPTSLSYWSGTSWTTTTATYTYDGNKGELWFTDGNTFSIGSHNWRLLYRYGWPIANVPQDLKMACAMLKDQIRHNAKKGLVSSESFPNSSSSYNQLIVGGVAMPFPKLVQNVIDKYRIMNYG